jgi:hypothetical protein
MVYSCTFFLSKMEFPQMSNTKILSSETLIILCRNVNGEEVPKWLDEVQKRLNNDAFAFGEISLNQEAFLEVLSLYHGLWTSELWKKCQDLHDAPPENIPNRNVLLMLQQDDLKDILEVVAFYEKFSIAAFVGMALQWLRDINFGYQHMYGTIPDGILKILLDRIVQEEE